MSTFVVAIVVVFHHNEFKTTTTSSIMSIGSQCVLHNLHNDSDSINTNININNINIKNINNSNNILPLRYELGNQGERVWRHFDPSFRGWEETRWPRSMCWSFSPFRSGQFIFNSFYNYLYIRYNYDVSIHFTQY